MWEKNKKYVRFSDFVKNIEKEVFSRENAGLLIYGWIFVSRKNIVEYCKQPCKSCMRGCSLFHVKFRKNVY